MSDLMALKKRAMRAEAKVAALTARVEGLEFRVEGLESLNRELYADVQAAGAKLEKVGEVWRRYTETLCAGSKLPTLKSSRDGLLSDMNAILAAKDGE